MSAFLCLHLSVEKGRDDVPSACYRWRNGAGEAASLVQGTGHERSSSLWRPLFDVQGTLLGAGDPARC